MRKTTFITREVWRSLDQDLRRLILRVTGLTRGEIVGKLYAARLEDELRARGEHLLADSLYLCPPGCHFDTRTATPQE